MGEKEDVFDEKSLKLHQKAVSALLSPNIRRVWR